MQIEIFDEFTEERLFAGSNETWSFVALGRYTWTHALVAVRS